jgi:asparagine synthase (glutamine-hydrolysing)
MVGSTSALASLVKNQFAYQDKEIFVVVEGAPIVDHPKLDGIVEGQGIATAIATSYKDYGPEMLQYLRGSFALAIVHRQEPRAFLAVDRIGIRSLTYALVDGVFVFASTVKALGMHPAIDLEIDGQALFDYLYFHVVPGPMSVYQGLHRLLPGSYVSFHGGRIASHNYWQMRYEESTSLPFKELKHQFTSLLDQCVRRCLTNENLGCFLSGGTDSSTIAGMVSRITGVPARTYSIGFGAPGYDEIKYARIAAEHFGTESHEYYVTPQDVVEAVPKIAAAYDDPYGNSSAVPTYYCALRAKEDGINRMLAGDGGDELFGGNTRYARQWLFSLYGDLPAPLRTQLIQPLLFAIPLGERLWPVRKLRRYVEQASLPMPDRLESYNLLSYLGVENVFEKDFLQTIDTNQPLNTLKQTYEHIQAQSMINRMLGLDLKVALADNDLPKVTKMCNLAGVDVDFPFLDEEIVSFSARLAPALKLKRTQLRYFFKEALRDFLPRETLAKSKHGFGLPFGPWLGSHKGVNELVMDSLSDLAARRIVRTDFMRNLMDVRLQDHAGYYGTMGWVLMMLEQWFKCHEDRVSPVSGGPDSFAST